LHLGPLSPAGEFGEFAERGGSLTLVAAVFVFTARADDFDFSSAANAAKSLYSSLITVYETLNGE